MCSPSETDKTAAVSRPRSGVAITVPVARSTTTAVDPRYGGKNTMSSSTTGTTDVDREWDRSGCVGRGVDEHCGGRARLPFVLVVAPCDREVVRRVRLPTVDTEFDGGDRLQRVRVVAVEALPVADPHRAVDDPVTVCRRPDIGLRQARARRVRLGIDRDVFRPGAHPHATVGRLQLEGTRRRRRSSRGSHRRWDRRAGRGRATPR